LNVLNNPPFQSTRGGIGIEAVTSLDPELETLRSTDDCTKQGFELGVELPIPQMLGALGKGPSSWGTFRLSSLKSASRLVAALGPRPPLFGRKALKHPGDITVERFGIFVRVRREILRCQTSPKQILGIAIE
jgi:hypothetical protein